MGGGLGLGDSGLRLVPPPLGEAAVEEGGRIGVPDVHGPHLPGRKDGGGPGLAVCVLRECRD